MSKRVAAWTLTRRLPAGASHQLKCMPTETDSEPRKPSDEMSAAPSNAPPLTNAELVQLQVRVIALENLVIALLAESSDAQRELVRDMATYISPRPGFTRHPLTLHAATQMLHLAERARHFSELDGPPT